MLVRSEATSPTRSVLHNRGMLDTFYSLFSLETACFRPLSVEV